MLILAPSILAADFTKLGGQIEETVKAGAEYIHLDVMDGMFVPQISFGMPVIETIRNCTDKVFDVHLMIEDPGRYIEAFAKAGADIITVHAEACTHLDRVIQQIRNAGSESLRGAESGDAAFGSGLCAGRAGYGSDHDGESGLRRAEADSLLPEEGQ